MLKLILWLTLTCLPMALNAQSSSYNYYDSDGIIGYGNSYSNQFGSTSSGTAYDQNGNTVSCFQNCVTIGESQSCTTVCY